MDLKTITEDINIIFKTLNITRVGQCSKCNDMQYSILNECDSYGECKHEYSIPAGQLCYEIVCRKCLKKCKNCDKILCSDHLRVCRNIPHVGGTNNCHGYCGECLLRCEKHRGFCPDTCLCSVTDNNGCQECPMCYPVVKDDISGKLFCTKHFERYVTVTK